MAVITISRQFGSHGDTVAQLLCERLDYLNRVINGAITWAVPQEEMGDALGTASALESLSRMIAPPVGGWMLGALGMWSPGLLAASIMSGLAVYAWRRLIAQRPQTTPTPAIAA